MSTSARLLLAGGAIAFVLGAALLLAIPIEREVAVPRPYQASDGPVALEVTTADHDETDRVVVAAEVDEPMGSSTGELREARVDFEVREARSLVRIPKPSVSCAAINGGRNEVVSVQVNEGVVAIRGARQGVTYALVVAAVEHETVSFQLTPRGLLNSLGSILLQAARVRQVAVVDGHSGLPIARARLYRVTPQPTTRNAGLVFGGGFAETLNVDSPHALTDEDGIATINTTEPICHIALVANGYELALSERLDRGDDAGQIRILLEPAENLSACVLRDGGEPCDDIGVSLRSAELGLAVGGRTGADGRLSACGFPAGDTVEVRATRTGTSVQDTLWLEVLAPLRRRVTAPVEGDVVLLLGEHRGSVVATWRSDEVEPGLPLRVELVQITDRIVVPGDGEGERIEAEAVVSVAEVELAAGRAELRPIRPGRYRVVAHGRGSGVWRSAGFEVDALAVSGGRPLQVALEPQPHRGFDLDVRLVDQQGASVADAVVRLRAVLSELGLPSGSVGGQIAEPQGEAETDCSGLCSFRALLPGSYTLVCGSRGLGLAVDTVRGESGVVTVTVQLGGSGAIEGVVKIEEPIPERGVRVVAENADASIICTAWIDERRSFRIDGLPPGNYVVSAGYPPINALEQTLLASSPLRRQGTSVAVRTGTTSSCEPILERCAPPMVLRVRDLPSDLVCEATFTRVLQADRIGQTRWQRSFAMPASGVLETHDLPMGAMGVAVVAARDGHVIAWGFLPDAERRLELVVSAAQVELETRDEGRAVQLVAVACGVETPLRGVVLRGERDGRWTRFDSVPYGDYRVVEGDGDDWFGRGDREIGELSVFEPIVRRSLRR